MRRRNGCREHRGEGTAETRAQVEGEEPGWIRLSNRGREAKKHTVMGACGFVTITVSILRCRGLPP